MTLSRPWLPVVIALAFVGGGQAPEEQAASPQLRFERHPYGSALDAFANYQSCGVRACAREVAALSTALRAGEAAATARGLGPVLERVKRDWLAYLAISSRVACARGPAAALAGARAAIRAFRSWVAGAHVAGGAGHDRPTP